jgi:hypothetical protein
MVRRTQAIAVGELGWEGGEIVTSSSRHLPAMAGMWNGDC